LSCGFSQLVAQFLFGPEKPFGFFGLAWDDNAAIKKQVAQAANRAQDDKR